MICEVCREEIRPWRDGMIYNPETRSVSQCQACETARAELRFQEKAFRSKAGTIIDLPLFESIGRQKIITTEILEAAKEEPRSCLIVGASGSGKTLLSKKFYNDLLRRYGGVPRKIMYRKEYELFKIFRDEERTDEFFELIERIQPEWVIIDEAFHEINWRDKEADRDKARLAHLNYYNFVDWFLYEPRWQHTPNVIMTANNDPEQVIGNNTENQRALVRRIHVVTTPAKKKQEAVK